VVLGGVEGRRRNKPYLQQRLGRRSSSSSSSRPLWWWELGHCGGSSGGGRSGLAAAKWWWIGADGDCCRHLARVRHGGSSCRVVAPQQPWAWAWGRAEFVLVPLKHDKVELNRTEPSAPNLTQVSFASEVALGFVPPGPLSCVAESGDDRGDLSLSQAANHIMLFFFRLRYLCPFFSFYNQEDIRFKRK